MIVAAVDGSDSELRSNSEAIRAESGSFPIPLEPCIFMLTFVPSSSWGRRRVVCRPDWQRCALGCDRGNMKRGSTAHQWIKSTPMNLIRKEGECNGKSWNFWGKREINARRLRPAVTGPTPACISSYPDGAIVRSLLSSEIALLISSRVWAYAGWRDDSKETNHHWSPSSLD